MRALFRVLLAVLAIVALATVSTAGAADEDDQVVLTIGLTNDVGNLNPIMGVEVPAYEVWANHYATLTDKAAPDLATIPGLAESWEASNGGKTYTYKLREGLKWSDGEPLTSEDVAWTINTARRQEWQNYTATIANITATTPDENTVVLRSSVPDPKLPTMDVYILPKHYWGKYDADQITKANGLDSPGSGAFVIDEVKRGQFWSLKVNENYWGGARPVDEVVYRLFNNADAMVAALKSGEIDAAHQVPSSAFASVKATEGIVALDGEQGGFTEIGVNGGRPEDQRHEGIGNGNPAMSDLEFRKALAYAIDKQTLINRVNNGIGRVATTISPSTLPKWIPEIPEAEQFTFDLDKAKSTLDAAGYTDTNGDGIREGKDGKNIVLDYYIRSESQTAAPNYEYVSGWWKSIGVGTTAHTVNDDKLIEVIGLGDYDAFEWGWTPFVDPDPMLSYFQCNQLSTDPDDPSNYYNDASWCDAAYDADYKAQNVELDQDTRVEIVHRMLRNFYDSATYHVLYYQGDLQAYRTDRFEGWTRMPGEVGPVLFANSNPTYLALKPLASSADDGGISTTAIVGIVIVGAAAIGLVAFLLTRRRTADERE